MKIEKEIKYLEEVIPLEGTEVGEAWQHLVDLYQSYGDYISENLRWALESEIIFEAERIKRDYKIVETKTTHEFIRKELVQK